MLHSETTAGSFYFSPSRDVLFLSVDYTDDQYYSDELKGFYDEQLNHIKMVLVLDHKWVDITPIDYIGKFLNIFDSLEIIRLLYLQNKYNIQHLHGYAMSMQK
jgi:hypothetical protein